MKKVTIVGAGIAGLSAGCHLQMNGYDTQIFKAHNLPGGACTSWKMKGYTIGNCIHWLVGSSPSDNFYMAGYWVQPVGGLPTAMKSGRDVAQITCKKDKKKFTTSGF